MDLFLFNNIQQQVCCSYDSKANLSSNCVCYLSSSHHTSRSRHMVHVAAEKYSLEDYQAFGKCHSSCKSTVDMAEICYQISTKCLLENT